MHNDRLVRIIDLKERLMEEKERALDQRNNELKAIDSNIGKLDNEITDNYAKLCTKCLDGNEFSVIKNYLEHLGRLRSAALAQKEQVEKRIAAIRAELYEMLKEIKMLDTLKTKTASALKKSQNRRLQKLLDEIALRLEGRNA